MADLRHTLTAGCLTVVAAAVPGTRLPAQAASSPVSAAEYGATVVDGLARVRAATAAFTNLDSAVAAGYAREVRQCFADAHHGAMGFHHVNRSVVDDRIEVERPEILLYERRTDGRYALNGVEYIIPYTRWPRDSVAPRVFDRELKRSDELKLWYLHMWVWTANPAGLFADWNPDVRCPTPPTQSPEP
jgi:hypothetical protein